MHHKDKKYVNELKVFSYCCLGISYAEELALMETLVNGLYENVFVLWIIKNKIEGWGMHKKLNQGKQSTPMR